jgi:hypothetical protein
VADEEGAHIFLSTKPTEDKLSGFAVMHVVLLGGNNSTARRFLSLVRKIRTYLMKRISNIGDEMAKAFFGKSATWRKRAPKG